MEIQNDSIQMVTWILSYLPPQQGEKGNKKRPQLFSSLVDTLNLLSYNLLDGFCWHSIPSCLSFCIRDSELPRYIHLDFIFPDTRIPDTVPKVLACIGYGILLQKLLTGLDLFLFFFQHQRLKLCCISMKKLEYDCCPRFKLREIIFNGIVVDQQFHFEETDTWSLLLKRELTDADILLHVTCILLIMTFPIVQMVSCRGPPQNTGPQAIACLACRIATPLSTTAPVRSPHTSYRWRGESHRASQVDGDN